MAEIRVDFSKSIASIKALHGGGQPPTTSNASNEYFHYLTEAGIPYSRLHDVGGAFGAGKYVDIPNLFRDFDADETDPRNYDFAFTDLLISQLVKAGVEPYFRLGVTIENAAHVKSYWIDPPRDYAKWARICEMVIRHYTEGWADGFHYKITYWEIWNEPENGQMWTGTAEDYYRLYDVASKHLRAKFPHLKFGGYAACGFYGAVGGGNPWNPEDDGTKDLPLIEFFHGFMRYVKVHGSPLDFFSWHTYSEHKNLLAQDAWLKEQLVVYGYGDVEVHLNEWNPDFHTLGTGHHAAEIAAVLTGIQHGRTDKCFIYDMRNNNAPFCALFHPITKKPLQGYYALYAFNRLYQLGEEAPSSSDTEGMYVLSAVKGEGRAMLLSNRSGQVQPLSFFGADPKTAKAHVIDNTRPFEPVDTPSVIENDSVLLLEW